VDVSGAEWWVQVRPATTPGEEAQPSAGGIGWHWDKDEELRTATGLFVHPHVSTVTYLSDAGAATVVLDSCADFASGTPPLDAPIRRGLASWPSAGKHLSFDGRHLHGVPHELLQIPVLPPPGRPAAVAEAARGQRVTFLVNIWLNYRPLGIQPFPDTLVCRMSAARHVGSLFRAPCCGKPICRAEESIAASTKDSETGLTATSFQMEGSGGPYHLTLRLPMLALRNARHAPSGSLRIVWKKGFYGRIAHE